MSSLGIFPPNYLCPPIRGVSIYPPSARTVARSNGRNSRGRRSALVIRGRVRWFYPLTGQNVTAGISRRGYRLWRLESGAQDLP